MKKISLFIVLVFSSFYARSQSLNYLWAQNESCTTDEFGTAVAADGLGNVYAVGTFSCSSVSFGSYTLTNTGSVAMYVVKYNENGNVLWAMTASGEANPWSVAIDGSGNVIVAGTFSGSLTIGANTLTSVNNSTDIFLLKMDSSGNNIWAQSAGGKDVDNAWSVATDRSGNIFLAGDFHSNTFLFDTVRITGGAPNGKMYILKYNSNGHALWARTSVGSNNSVVYSVATDSEGNVFAAGAFASPSIVFGLNVLQNNGGSNVFIAKYDRNGNVLWGRGSTGTGFNNPNGVAVDGNGSCYITGSYTATGISFGNINMSSAGKRDIFLSKYDAAGNLQWARSAGGNDGDIAFSVCTDTRGAVYIGGFYKSSSITFGSTVLNNSVQGVPDAYVAKYDENGNALSAANAAGNDDDELYGVTCDATGVFITGFFLSSELNCNSIMLNNSGSGTSDMLIAKLNSTAVRNEKLSGDNSASFLNVSVYPNSAQHILNIESDIVNADLKIFDTVGRIVLQEELHSTLSTINCQLSTGVYLVRVEAERKVYQKKLVVE